MKLNRKGFLQLLSGMIPGIAVAQALEPLPPVKVYPSIGVPDDWDEDLAAWLRLARHPVWDCQEDEEEGLRRLVLACRTNGQLTFVYWGGETPGTQRTISPALVFRVDGFPDTYVSGYCHLRQAERVFRLDRIEWG